MHHGNLLEHCFFDIDGVLCVDPTEAQNDDGPVYEQFLNDAIPLFVPSKPIGALVTRRLEKYRKHTEQWLAQYGVKYKELHMLKLETKQERLRQSSNDIFKATVYRNSKALLFIESDYKQAQDIAKASGKPVLCIETQHIIYPDPFSKEALRQITHNIPLRMKLKNQGRLSKIKKSIKKLLRST